MRQQLKPGSFRLWRDRVHGRETKHVTIRSVALEAAIGIRRATERCSAETTARLF